jgi:hypothetical protein
VTYRNLIIAAAISSPDHPFWQWLARRNGRIAGLGLHLRLEVLRDNTAENADQQPDWTQPLQTLSGIPDVHVRLEWVGCIFDLGQPCIAQWLKQHGRLINHLTVELRISEDRLNLRQFSEAAAPCRSIDLTINLTSSQVIDLADLSHVAGSLQNLHCATIMEWASLRGTIALSTMSQLTSLHVTNQDLGNE